MKHFYNRLSRRNHKKKNSAGSAANSMQNFHGGSLSDASTSPESIQGTEGNQVNQSSTQLTIGGKTPATHQNEADSLYIAVAILEKASKH